MILLLGKLICDSVLRTLFKPFDFSSDIYLGPCFLMPTIAREQTAAIIDGKSIADQIRSNIGSEVRRMKESIGMVPGLGVIMVGQRKDSETYVRNKMMACEEVGMKSYIAQLPDHCTKDQLLKALSKFDVDPSVHGILVQLPLPQVIS